MSHAAAFSLAEPLDWRYRVAAWSMLRLSVDDVAALRKSPEAFFSPNAKPFPLKHADDQTIGGLAAVFRAVDAFGLGTADFSSWGVAAMPRFIGRITVAKTWERYKIDGPWGVSMQLVPHNTLHSQASTITLALGSHGPAIGAGGGQGSEADAALAALTMLHWAPDDGVWMIWTGWSPELEVDSEQRRLTDSRMVALALAIQGVAKPEDVSRFRIHAGALVPRDPRGAALGVTEQPVDAIAVLDRCCQIEATSLALALDLGGDLRLDLDLRPPIFAPRVPAPLGAKFSGALSSSSTEKSA